MSVMETCLMTPEDYEQRAQSLFLEGYNCAQSVVGAFADRLGIPKEMAVRMASPFGGGMGRMREVCGCVSGMFLVLGALSGYDDPKAFEEKKELYRQVQELADLFREQNGSIVCRELLGLAEKEGSYVPSERTEAYYRKRPCAQLAGCAAKILEEYLCQR